MCTRWAGTLLNTTSVLTLPARSVALLDAALSACLEFPAPVRSHLGCELISLRRSGLSPAWEHVRGMSGAASLSLRRANTRSSATLYRLICATSIPQAFIIVHALAQETVRPVARIPQRDLGFARARLLDVTFDIQERRAPDAGRVHQRPMCSNVFLQLGIPNEHSVDLLQRAEMIAELRQILRRYGVDQVAPHADLVTRAVISGDIENVSLSELRALSASLSNDEN